MSFNIPKGTKDVLPEDSYKWHYIEDAVRETTRLFDVKEIRTPTFEHTELFLRGVGDTTDIVNKEMYTFFDKGNRSITLKPEGTAGVARCFVENSLYAGPLREDLLHHARFQIRTSAGGQTSRTSPVRRGALRQLRRGNGRRGDFDCKILIRKTRA